MIPLLFALQAAAFLPKAEPHPNVVVVVLDDLSADDLPNIPTPRLDALAAEGTVRTSFYSNPTCSVTRVSAMFGVWRSRGGGLVCDGYDPALAPSPADLSVADAFAAHGYDTAHFGKWHMGSVDDVPWETSPFEHGFGASEAMSPTNVSFCSSTSYTNWLRSDGGAPAYQESAYHTTEVRDAFLAYLDERRPKPFFAWVALQAPHGPFHQPPPELAPEPAPPVNVRKRFESMVVSADTVVGQIADALPRNTVLVVIGDNGTPPQVPWAGQDPARLKGSVYEGGIRVPFIAAGPTVPRRIDERPAHVVHLGNILLGYAALPSASFPDGQQDHIFTGIDRMGGALEEQYAVIWQGHKLVERPGGFELYDLKTDPQELSNEFLNPSFATVRAELESRLTLYRP